MKLDSERKIKIATLIGSHGKREMQAAAILEDRLIWEPIPGVLAPRAHPDAVIKDKRKFGDYEIMSQYPGIVEGNPEQRAAYWNTRFLTKLKPQVIFDIHETTSGNSFFGIGERTTVSTLAGGKIMSGNNCLVHNGLSFFETFPNSAAIENRVAEGDAARIANNLYIGLMQVVSTNLEEVTFDAAIEGVNFYQKFEIPSMGSDGQLAPYLEELEDTVPSCSDYLPLILSDTLKELLSIPEEATISYGTSGHNNMSEDASQTLGYTASGIPRREFFGSFQIRIAPPIQTNDGLVIFRREERPLLRKPRGLKSLV